MKEATGICSGIRGRLTVLFAGLLIAGLSFPGCGGDDSSDSAVVEPPSPVRTGSASGGPESPAGSKQPPGGLELPAGDIPAPEEDQPDPDSGIEMPEDESAPTP